MTKPMPKQETWSTENKGKPWTDDELAVVLSDAPTKDNCIKYAKAFKRGYGSIAQIYQWAMTPKKLLKQKENTINMLIKSKEFLKNSAG